jgi:hypothetical protein
VRLKENNKTTATEAIQDIHAAFTNLFIISFNIIINNYISIQ